MGVTYYQEEIMEWCLDYLLRRCCCVSQGASARADPQFLGVVPVSKSRVFPELLPQCHPQGHPGHSLGNGARHPPSQPLLPEWRCPSLQPVHPSVFWGGLLSPGLHAEDLHLFCSTV